MKNSDLLMFIIDNTRDQNFHATAFRSFSIKIEYYFNSENLVENILKLNFVVGQSDCDCLLELGHNARETDGNFLSGVVYKQSS